jgi:glutamyl-tRNA synthetase
LRSPFRDGNVPPPHADAPYVVRLRAPDHGEIVNEDLVQGPVTVRARDIDDLVLLRADGTPTYMLAVVVDDHDMGVTHVIRGDDHLTNAARQIPLFRALDWSPPAYAHIPLIHGPDGAKLSKRHGALGVQAYRDMGYLPEGLLAYLMRLGWGRADDGFERIEDAAKRFSLEHLNKSPSRLDFAKLDSINAAAMKLADDARLAELALTAPPLDGSEPLSPGARGRILAAMPALKQRAKTVTELSRLAFFLGRARPFALDEAAMALIKGETLDRLKRLRSTLDGVAWDEASLSEALKAFAAAEGVGLGKIGPAVRAVLTGGAPALDLGQTLSYLGREETLARLDDQLDRA